MGLSVAVHVSDQLVRQYTKCAKIMECRNVLAAFSVKLFLMCLKFRRLNLMWVATFLTWLLKVRVESRVTPRYLNSVTKSSSVPFTNMFECVICWARLEKIIHTVFLVFNRRQDLVSQAWTSDIADDRMRKASWLFVADVKITASSAYICVCIF